MNDNWNITCDCFAIGAGCFSLIFFFFNVLPDIMNDKKEKEELHKKSEKIKLIRESMKPTFKGRRPLITISDSVSINSFNIKKA